MRWLSCFGLLLYLSLLCTPQAFAVHDTRLSPLADTQFHAIAAATSELITDRQQDSTDDTSPALPVAMLYLRLDSAGNRYLNVKSAANDLFLAALRARAPPRFSVS